MQPRLFMLSATLILVTAPHPAGAVPPVQLSSPANATEISRQCEDAFDALDKEKQAYEGTVNEKCLSNLSLDRQKQLKEGFMAQCQNTFTLHANSQSSGKVEISPELLQNIFNGDAAYGFAFKKYCMDGEINSFNQGQEAARQAQKSGDEPAEGSARDNNSCDYAFWSGCNSAR